MMQDFKAREHLCNPWLESCMHPLSQQQALAYLRYLDTPFPSSANLINLDRLIAAHQRQIVFENIDVLLDLPIPINGDAVFTKVVERQRGGYCFELNSLFARLLLAVGYQVELLGARVRWGLQPDAPPSMLSHLMLRVLLDEGPYLVDVSMGSATPWRALPLSAPIPKDLPYRLVPQGDGTGEIQLEFLHALGDWTACYRFRPEVLAWIDCVPLNWHTSTHPNSVFRNSLMIARRDAECSLTLTNGLFNRRYRDGRLESFRIQDTFKLIQIIKDDFHLTLAKDETERLKLRLPVLLEDM